MTAYPPPATHTGKALFLDRDGVINEDDPNYTWLPEKFHYTDFIFPLAQEATRLGYKIVVITNQGGISKGFYTHEHVLSLHAKMIADFSRKGVHIHRVLYCPHHALGSNCMCRKPKSLLFERALALEQLDPTRCLMVGDRCRDLIPARQLGMRTLLLGDDSCTEAMHRQLPPFDVQQMIQLLHS